MRIFSLKRLWRLQFIRVWFRHQLWLKQHLFWFFRFHQLIWQIRLQHHLLLFCRLQWKLQWRLLSLLIWQQRCLKILRRKWRRLKLRPWWGWSLRFCLIQLKLKSHHWCWLRWFIISQWSNLKLQRLERRFLIFCGNLLCQQLWLLLKQLLFYLR